MADTGKVKMDDGDEPHITGLGDRAAASYTQDTVSRVPASIARSVDLVFHDMFKGLSLSDRPRPKPPSTKLAMENKMTQSMHAYFRECTAEARGCAVYGTESEKILFVTDLFSHKLTTEEELLVGQYAGKVDYFFQIWECGEILVDGKTENPYKKKIPKIAEDAEKMLMDSGVIEITASASKASAHLFKQEMNVDVEDPYKSAEVYVDIIRKRKRE